MSWLMAALRRSRNGSMSMSEWDPDDSTVCSVEFKPRSVCQPKKREDLSLRDAWALCAEMMTERDRRLMRAWADQADGLITFAALFSGVVTSFIIATYTSLQPDKQELLVDLVRQILSVQVNGTAAAPAGAGTLPPFEPELFDIFENALLLASLICTLLSAGTGILFKEWLREYTLGTPTNPHELVWVREHRFQAIETWAMKEILAAIANLLQIGVAFFIGAVVIFAWPLHLLVRVVVNIFAVFWIGYWIATACCPLFSPGCPYRSPIARLIYAVVMGGGKALFKAWRNPADRSPSLFLQNASNEASLEKRERDMVRDMKDKLEVEALAYLFKTHWGDKRLLSIAPCFGDIDVKKAEELLRELLSGHSQQDDALERELNKALRRIEGRTDGADGASSGSFAGNQPPATGYAAAQETTAYDGTRTSPVQSGDEEQGYGNATMGPRIQFPVPWLPFPSPMATQGYRQVDDSEDPRGLCQSN